MLLLILALLLGGTDCFYEMFQKHGFALFYEHPSMVSSFKQSALIINNNYKHSVVCNSAQSMFTLYLKLNSKFWFVHKFKFAKLLEVNLIKEGYRRGGGNYVFV